MKKIILCALASLFLTPFVHSELHRRDLDGTLANGYEAVYDDVLDITWLIDASLARTYKFDLRNEIRSFGSMSGETALKYIQAMNAHDNGKGLFGVNSWRLPGIKPQGVTYDTTFTYDGSSDTGYQVAAPIGLTNPYGKSEGFLGSELAYHYYVNLGLYGMRWGSGETLLGQNLDNPSPADAPYSIELAYFKNLPFSDYYSIYMSGNKLSASSYDYMAFNFYAGVQGSVNINRDNFMVWPVADGDVLPPPNDSDEDSVFDTVDNCPGLANPDQSDIDADGLGDACDPFPESDNHEYAQCQVDLDNAVLEIDSLTQENQQLKTSLNRCLSKSQEKDQVIENLTIENRQLRSLLDTDADGVPDEADECPGTLPWHWNVKPNGCHKRQIAPPKWRFPFLWKNK